MIHFPLMPVSEPGELDPMVHMAVMTFESSRDYFNWQTQQALSTVPEKRWRMATYAECGNLLYEIYRETQELAREMKERGMI